MAGRLQNKDEKVIVDGIELESVCKYFRDGVAEYRVNTFVWWYAPIVVPGVFGCLLNIGANWHRRAPWHTQMPLTLLYGAIGLGVGWKIQDIRKRQLAERDRHIFYYMTLHPEDFKAKERVRYRDYLTTWHPFR